MTFPRILTNVSLSGIPRFRPTIPTLVAFVNPFSGLQYQRRNLLCAIAAITDTRAFIHGKITPARMRKPTLGVSPFIFLRLFRRSSMGINCAIFPFIPRAPHPERQMISLFSRLNFQTMKLKLMRLSRVQTIDRCINSWTKKDGSRISLVVTYRSSLPSCPYLLRMIRFDSSCMNYKHFSAMYSQS